eukprot:1146574-Pelagomonas_calceolata.AAC.1
MRACFGKFKTSNLSCTCPSTACKQRDKEALLMLHTDLDDIMQTLQLRIELVVELREASHLSGKDPAKDET